ncbi:hypothetical protein LX36DRAFT_439747 [Colletotrichum falcatum]|nr:hypothetical protein LX36DRAFT_439747 [Colletotrichum falcatum]
MDANGTWIANKIGHGRREETTSPVLIAEHLQSARTSMSMCSRLPAGSSASVAPASVRPHADTPVVTRHRKARTAPKSLRGQAPVQLCMHVMVKRRPRTLLRMPWHRARRGHLRCVHNLPPPALSGLIWSPLSGAGRPYPSVATHGRDRTLASSSTAASPT